ncbi:MAG TPA: alpha/beta hydrolase [Methylibium sp.]|uniref:alpha/beta fold hydrolase n=1 Tax=Methylibium sp. TaxID=2067992 RepID=UPI002DBFF835|nr:alpha/beta hydrolase [Methylibium sp.]HEU4459647.1 alpha/beta hydrolase [Methylibium sp.]
MKLELAGHAAAAYAYTGGKPFDASLPLVVFVHGAMNDHSVWALHSRWFAHHGRAVLAVDLPGHGRSAGPALGSVEALADWLVALIDAAGTRDRIALVGHSMGSLVALEAAARLGARADALAMIGTAFPMKVSTALFECALADPLEAIDRVNTFSHSTLAAKPSNPGPGTWLHGASRALMRRQQERYAAAGHGNLFHHDFGVCDRYRGANEAAQRVVCPAQLLLGAHDSMTPPKAAQSLVDALAANLGGGPDRGVTATLAAGHALMAETPDAVLNALKRLITA